MKKSAAILLLVFLAINFSCCSLEENSAERVLVEPVQYPTAAMDELREVDYLVYSAILEKSSGIEISVARKTQPARLDVMTDEIKEKFVGLDPRIIENFNAKSDKAVFFAPGTPLKMKVTFFDEAESKSPAKTARDMEKLFEHYPYYRFSRIGFSHDDKEALVYADYMCGLCGGGNYYWLRNVDGKWEIIDELGTWVS
jgi:hypothetical protein